MEPKFDDLALSAVFDGNGDRVVAGDWTGKIRVFTVADGKAQGELTSIPPTLAARIEDAQKRSTALQPPHDKAVADAKQPRTPPAKMAADAKAMEESFNKAKAAFDAADANAKTTAAAQTTAAAELKAPPMPWRRCRLRRRRRPSCGPLPSASRTPPFFSNGRAAGL